MLLTVNASGDGFDEAQPFQLDPGEYAFEFVAGTADAGTLTIVTTKDEISGDSGRDVKNENGVAYSWNLASDSYDGCKFHVGGKGYLIVKITGGDEDDTLYAYVGRLR